MDKDYYQILGVARAATADDVAAAFKESCLRFYPGMQRETDPDLEKHFGEIAEAYQVLADPRDRAFYDHLGYRRFNEGVTDRFGNRVAGFGVRKGWKEVFLEFCGAGGVYTSASPVADDYLSYVSKDARKARLQPKHVTLKVPITLLEVAEGKRIEVKYMRTVVEPDGIRTKTVETVKSAHQVVSGPRRLGLHQDLPVQGRGQLRAYPQPQCPNKPTSSSAWLSRSTPASSAPGSIWCTPTA